MEVNILSLKFQIFIVEVHILSLINFLDSTYFQAKLSNFRKFFCKSEKPIIA